MTTPSDDGKGPHQETKRPCLTTTREDNKEQPDLAGLEVQVAAREVSGEGHVLGDAEPVAELCRAQGSDRGKARPHVRVFVGPKCLLPVPAIRAAHPPQRCQPRGGGREKGPLSLLGPGAIPTPRAHTHTHTHTHTHATRLPPVQLVRTHTSRKGHKGCVRRRGRRQG